jgi:NADPH-dependent 2,4-dienoyl-CoA reductase/sulfur reductase-like enzyme
VVRTPQQFKEMQDIEVKTEHRVTKIDPKEKKIEVVNLAKKAEYSRKRFKKYIHAQGSSRQHPY